MEITANQSNIDFAPGNVYTEIAQNVRTILTTQKYTVPLNRNFGLNNTLVDDAIPATKAKLTAEIIAAIQKYEQRVEVLKVTFTGDAANGILRPKVQVKIVGT